ncbi:MAG TPA: DUF4439 domain-containing protein [Jatrophihabitans sp.]|nr:DUF4439 domain-containing protein [Jatrophihabitans sp.]
MAQISRRTLLGGSLLAAAAVAGAGLGVVGPVHHEVALPPAEPPAALTDALARQQQLLAAYESGQPEVGSISDSMRANVAAHGDALRALLELYPGWRLAQRTASPGPTATSDPAAGTGGLGAMCTRDAQLLRQAVLGWPAAEPRASQVLPVLASIEAALSTQALMFGYPLAPSSGTPVAAGVRQVPQPIVDGLQQVLAAQHLAVFGYPLIGVHLGTDADVARARDLEAAHRLTRDAVAGQLVALGVTPAASASSYPPPAPVTGAEAATAWAVRIEERSAAAYRYLLEGAVRAGGDQRALRGQALDGLTAAALAATTWRLVDDPKRATVPFPGAPGS